MTDNESNISNNSSKETAKENLAENLTQEENDELLEQEKVGSEEVKASNEQETENFIDSIDRESSEEKLGSEVDIPDFDLLEGSIDHDEIMSEIHTVEELTSMNDEDIEGFSGSFDDVLMNDSKDAEMPSKAYEESEHDEIIDSIEDDEGDHDSKKKGEEIKGTSHVNDEYDSLGKRTGKAEIHEEENKEDQVKESIFKKLLGAASGALEKLKADKSEEERAEVEEKKEKEVSVKPEKNKKEEKEKKKEKKKKETEKKKERKKKEKDKKKERKTQEKEKKKVKKKNQIDEDVEEEDIDQVLEDDEEILDTEDEEELEEDLDEDIDDEDNDEEDEEDEEEYTSIYDKDSEEDDEEEYTSIYDGTNQSGEELDTEESEEEEEKTEEVEGFGIDPGQQEGYFDKFAKKEKGPFVPRATASTMPSGENQEKEEENPLNKILSLFGGKKKSKSKKKKKAKPKKKTTAKKKPKKKVKKKSSAKIKKDKEKEKKKEIKREIQKEKAKEKKQKKKDKDLKRKGRKSKKEGATQNSEGKGKKKKIIIIALILILALLGIIFGVYKLGYLPFTGKENSSGTDAKGKILDEEKEPYKVPNILRYDGTDKDADWFKVNFSERYGLQNKKGLFEVLDLENEDLNEARELATKEIVAAREKTKDEMKNSQENATGEKSSDKTKKDEVKDKKDSKKGENTEKSKDKKDKSEKKDKKEKSDKKKDKAKKSHKEEKDESGKKKSKKLSKKQLAAIAITKAESNTRNWAYYSGSINAYNTIGTEGQKFLSSDFKNRLNEEKAYAKNYDRYTNSMLFSGVTDFKVTKTLISEDYKKAYVEFTRNVLVQRLTDPTELMDTFLDGLVIGGDNLQSFGVELIYDDEASDFRVTNIYRMENKKIKNENSDEIDKDVTK